MVALTPLRQLIIMMQSAAPCCIIQPLENSMASKHRISVNLSESEYRELSALSVNHRVSMAWLGRQAIAEFLERYRDENLQLPLALPSKGAQK